MGVGICVHASHFLNTISTMFQRSRLRRSPFCSVASIAGALSGAVVSVVLDGFALGLFIAQPEKMRGSLHMCKGVKAFLSRSVTLSQISL